MVHIIERVPPKKKKRVDGWMNCENEEMTFGRQSEHGARATCQSQEYRERPDEPDW
jgi:hypothetical protein